MSAVWVCVAEERERGGGGREREFSVWVCVAEERERGGGGEGGREGRRERQTYRQTDTGRDRDKDSLLSCVACVALAAPLLPRTGSMRPRNHCFFALPDKPVL